MFKAVIYKDWNQIANCPFENISEEEALVQIYKTHSNVKHVRFIY